MYVVVRWLLFICVVFICNFGFIMLKWRVEVGSGMFVVGVNGRLLCKGVYVLWDWKLRK